MTGKWKSIIIFLSFVDALVVVVSFFGAYNFKASQIHEFEDSFDWTIDGADLVSLGAARALLGAAAAAAGQGRLRGALRPAAQVAAAAAAAVGPHFPRFLWEVLGLVGLLYGLLKAAVLDWAASKVIVLLIWSLAASVLHVMCVQVVKKAEAKRVKGLALYEKLNTGDDEEAVVASGADEEGKRRPLGPLALLRVLKPYFWPSGDDPGAFLNRVRSSATWAFVGASKAATVTSPIFLAHATNRLAAGDYQACVTNLGAYVAFSFMGKFFKEMQGLVYLKVKQAAYIEIAQRTFAHLHNLSLQWHLKKRMGNVIRSMDRGSEAANTLTNYLFLYLLPSLAECLAVCVVFALKFRSWEVALLAFCSVCIYGVVTVRVTLWRKKFRQRSNKHDNDFHDKATDSIINYETVKYFTNEPFEIRRFTDSVRLYQENSINVQASLSFLNLSQQVIVQLTVLGGLWLSAIAVKNGELDVGGFVAVNTYMVNLFTPLNFLGTVYNAIINALVDIRNLSELLNESPDVVDPPGARPLPLPPAARRGGGGGGGGGVSVEYRGVHFRYPEQPDARGIQDLSFRVEAGTTTAIVGHTGAGKTTIARLLFRFYDPLAGQVLLNGHDISQVTQRSVRAAIGVVPQDTVMFNETILHNVKYGRMEASMDEVEAACEAAQILEFIKSLPEGWETKVGERGLKLSGGEKQRVAIARCLLKDPPVVLLDEATSALDTKTELSVQEALAGLRRDRTTLVIAHRLSTIRRADQIVVLHLGRVVERGTHAALLARDGEYTSMWRTQLRNAGASREDRSAALAELQASGLASVDETLEDTPVEKAGNIGSKEETAAAGTEQKVADTPPDAGEKGKKEKKNNKKGH